MAMLIDGQRGAGAKSANETSNAALWKPGMTYVSPVTGRRSKNAVDVPGTAEHKARQAAAQEARYTGNKSPVVTAPAPAARTASTASFGAMSGDGGPAAAQAAAEARAAANNSARNSANSQKSQLQSAIDAALAQKGANQSKLDALTKLVTEGLQGGRDTHLKGIEGDLKTLLDQAFGQYGQTVSDLNKGLRDNEKSESDSSFSNLANRARESMDLVTQALSQGAGESDVLKTQLQALRNWNSNQGEVNRSYFDTLTSANSAITDLNVGTKSTLTGYEMDANQRRAGVWGDFYSGMADSYTQMDNLATNNYLLDREVSANQGQMSSQDALLAWLDSGKGADGFVAPAAQAAAAAGPFKGYAEEAATWAGKAWENPGVSETTKNWQGQETVGNPLNSSQAWAAATNESAKGAQKKKPEGATLRKW